MTADSLAPGHVFSQSSLAALDRCPRRFYLQYVRRLAWPAPLTGADVEWEEALRRGQHFHLLVQQHRAGVDVEATVEALEDAELQTWWAHYRRDAPAAPARAVEYAEVEVTAPVGAHVLVAKCDLVVCRDDGRVLIVDWKTGARAPDPVRQAHSWQTVAYRYAVAEGGAGLLPGAREGAGVAPENVELMYWHAAFPGATHTIPYGEAEHEEARRRLEGAVARVEALGLNEEEYARTDQLDECRRCGYRSYCDRGRDGAAAEWDDEGDELDLWNPPELD